MFHFIPATTETSTFQRGFFSSELEFEEDEEEIKIASDSDSGVRGKEFVS